MSKDEMKVMDALVLKIIRQKIAENPGDNEYRRLYAVCKSATVFSKLPLERREAVMQELAAMLKDES